MNLPPIKLKHFSHYTISESIKDSSSMKIMIYDEITIHYVREEDKFFGGTRTITWSEDYIFKRHEAPSEDREGYSTFTMNEEYIELKSQFDDIVKGEWNYVSNEVMKFLQDKHPERII